MQEHEPGVARITRLENPQLQTLILDDAVLHELPRGNARATLEGEPSASFRGSHFVDPISIAASLHAPLVVDLHDRAVAMAISSGAKRWEVVVQIAAEREAGRVGVPRTRGLARAPRPSSG